jgi:adenylate cyclase
MFRLFTKLDEGATIRELLALEELKGERIRGRSLMGIFAALFIVALGAKYILLPRLPSATRYLGGAFPIGMFVLLLGLMLVYEALFYAFLSRLVARRTTVFDGPRYGNILIETAFVTGMLIVLATKLSPALALGSPAVFVYFPFILLSILRMKFLFSFATGALSAAAYGSLGLVYFPPGTGTGIFDTFMPVLAKSALLLLSGAIAGYVAAEVRKRVENSLRLSGERERIVSMFGQYISAQVVDKLLAQKTEFEGETRHVAIMFFDVRNFTLFSSTRGPQEVVDFLNILFGELIPVVNRHNGMINKFLGDGFMAVFGAPLSDGRDAANAVAAGLEICETVDRMNMEGRLPATRIGIGLHCGEAVTGTVGSRERKEYTIIGDTVNLASRIEQLNKVFGSAFLVSESVYALAGASMAKAERMEAVEVKGKEEKIQTYRLA